MSRGSQSGRSLTTALAGTVELLAANFHRGGLWTLVIAGVAQSVGGSFNLYG